MVGERGQANEKGDKILLIDEQEKDDEYHYAEQGEKFQNIGRPGACLVVKEETCSLNKGRQGVGKLCWFKVEAKSMKIGLDLGNQRAFLEEGVYLGSDTSVSSPLIQT